MGRRATKIDQNEAMNYVGGYTLALDMTARDWQVSPFLDISRRKNKSTNSYSDKVSIY